MNRTIQGIMSDGRGDAAMPSPYHGIERLNFAVTATDVHQDVLLTNMAIGYTDSNIIADTIFPVVTVGKQSNTYPVWSRADAMRIEAALRAPGTEANMIDVDVSSDTYFAKNYALKMPVTIETKANADPIMLANVVNGRVVYIRRKLDLGWEQRVASLVNSTSNVGSSAAVSSAWTDYTNSDPIADINTALDAAEDATGTRPRIMTFGYEAWRNFRRNTAVRDIIYGQNNGGGFVSRQEVADLFEVDRVQIGNAYYNSANQAQAEVVENLWQDNVLLHYSPDNPSVDLPSFGYTFRWAGGGLAEMQAERHPFDPKKKSEEIEIGYYQDEKITGAEYSFLITNTSSSQ